MNSMSIPLSLKNRLVRMQCEQVLRVYSLIFDFDDSICSLLASEFQQYNMEPDGMQINWQILSGVLTMQLFGAKIYA
jgi:hypothetical protein